jgi:hypothetical protein
MRMKAFVLIPAILTAAAAPAWSQGYQTSFDDMTGWLAGSGTTTSIGWWNDATPSTVPGGPTRTGANSLNYNNGANYDSGSINNTGVAYSPYVNLAGLTTPTLSFWCNFETQPGSENVSVMRDQRQVILIPGNLYPAVSEAIGVVNSGPTLGPCSAMGTWHRHTVPLNPSWGALQVAFVFSSVDALQNGHAGWFIDDFAIDNGAGTGTGGGAPPPNPAPAPAPTGSDREGDEGLCGLTGLEVLLVLGLAALRRRRA